jgi:hypothetical protein
MPQTKPPAIYRVRLTGSEARARAFLAAHPLEPQNVRVAEGTVTMDVFVSERLMPRVADFGLRSEVLFNATARAAQRMREVGQGNRFERGEGPISLGVRVRPKAK